MSCNCSALGEEMSMVFKNMNLGAVARHVSQKRKEDLYSEAYETNSVNTDDKRAGS